MKSEILGLQYLRGLAALAVVLDHTAGMAAFEKYFGVELWHGFLYSGSCGVDLFFVLSGFIICVISLRGSPLVPIINWRIFIVRRFVRIVPVMWLAIITYAGLRLAGRGTFFLDPYLRALILFPAGDVQPNQIWTLRHEFIFYIIFAVSFLAGSRKEWLLIGWALSPVILFMFNFHGDGNVSFRQFIYLVMNPVNVEFVTGFGLGLFWIFRSRHFSFENRFTFQVMIIFVIIMMSIHFYLNLGFGDVISTSISSVVAGIILFFCVHSKSDAGGISRIGKLLGDASYSIYLFHPHFVSAILGVWSRTAHGTPIVIVIAVTTIVAAICGILIHKFVEQPLIRMCRQLVDSRPEPVAVVRN